MAEVFLLFENTKNPAEPGFCFSAPVAEIRADTLDQVQPCFEELESWRARGYFLAGYVAYEAGWAWMGGSKTVPRCAYPLVQFFAFKEKQPITQNLDPHPEPTALFDFQRGESAQSYQNKIKTIFSQLRAGNTYQVNFTLRERFQSSLENWDLYKKLRSVQKVEYAAYLKMPHLEILSFSPELFLKKQGSRLLSKPMKGTMPRNADPEQDRRNREFLREDLKSRAENVMIVDLLRNDMGRLAEPGSVKAEPLFEVEEYATVHQMTSTVECKIPIETTVGKIFASLFPCGSITGAPKKRTMEIIAGLETEPRGVYTGAIGYITPENDFSFNVAIRTLVSERHGRHIMGIGGGILIDSDPAAEHRESLLKSRFVKSLNDFELLETVLFDGTSYRNLALHLDRMEKSADSFGFEFDRETLHNGLQQKKPSQPQRVRISLRWNGTTQIQFEALAALPDRPLVTFSQAKINSTDIFRRHKTTRRDLYETEFAQARTKGFYEVLFFNERDELVEGSRHNIFLKIKNRWHTPPLSAGALPGIQRNLSIQELKAAETALLKSDVENCEEILLTNSLRGSINVFLEACK